MDLAGVRDPVAQVCPDPAPARPVCRHFRTLFLTLRSQLQLPPAACRRELDHTKLEEWQRRNDEFEDVAHIEYLWHARVHVHERDKEGKLDYVWADLDALLSTVGAPEVDFHPMDLSVIVMDYELRAAKSRAAMFQQYAPDTAAAQPPADSADDSADDE